MYEVTKYVQTLKKVKDKNMFCFENRKHHFLGCVIQRHLKTKQFQWAVTHLG